MSFLRALRAYVGLGPDEEIEDGYLFELNARRRRLDLGELDQRAVDTADYVDLEGTDGAARSGEEPPGEAYAGPRARSVRPVSTDVELDGLGPVDLRGTDGPPRLGRDRTSLSAPATDDATVGSAATPPNSPPGVNGRGAVVHSLDSMRAKPRTLTPESFGDAKLVADEFKRDIPVLLNLQAVERDLARRLIDFASGICYALDGSMEKIAAQVFLLTPEGVEVSEDDRRRIEERGYAR